MKDVIEQRVLSGLFFFSGFAALIYQTVWQRALYTIYGTTSEAGAVVVSVFMLGLGVGSLLGGELLRRGVSSPVKLFAMAELGIGAFGLISLPLIHWLGKLTAGADIATAGILAFGVLLFPTLMMGATLPLLVGHLVERNPHIGSVMGDLYYVNTLGSALGCVMIALILFYLFGMSGVVMLAALINLSVAAVAMKTWGRA